MSLQSIKETLGEKLEDLGGASAGSGRSFGRREGLVETGKVFVVHGHDDLAKSEVARFLERIGLEPIILHEQPSGGKTIIEKLESHIEVDFAVVIFTPDDVVYDKEHPEKKVYRARQNVILELGIFLGALGRSRVCVLHKGKVDVPSDFKGVVFVPLDDGQGWKIGLASELRQAELTIDFNNAIT